MGNLPQECQSRAAELTIRPEVIDGYYAVECQYLAFDEEMLGWELLADFSEDDP